MPWEVEEKFEVVLGGSAFINTPNLIVYRGESVFRIERHSDSGYLGISFKIYDESGATLATIGQNRLFINKKYKGPKSIILQGSIHNYSVVERPSERVICNIKRKEESTPAELEVSVALYMPDGFLLQATPNSINLPTNNLMMNSAIDNSDCGILFKCPNDPPERLGAGIVVSVPEEYCRKPVLFK